ncbi:MAG: hypothetical protein ACE368_05440 [Paracoccaceae bacterium]
MAITLHVMYPTDGGTTFDHDYYATSHMALVGEHFGPHMVSASASKGLAGGPDTPPGFHAVAMMLFEDQSNWMPPWRLPGRCWPIFRTTTAARRRC